MPSVTYHNQPAIAATHGKVPLEGTKRPYTVRALLWPEDVERWIAARLIGVSLHVCCGKSQLGTYRVDMNESAHVRADAARLPFRDRAVDTVLIDPPYNGVFQWNHDMLAELARVARQRIIFQHWFTPVDKDGRFKKAHRFQLVDLALWQPQTYFGRAQVITVMDETQAVLWAVPV